VTNGRRFFGRHPATRSFPPTFETRWFDRDNVNATLAELNVPSEIDLLSLDVDGNDLYIWDALSVTRPRVLVCEFNNVVPSDRSVTIPYRPDFMWQKLPAKHQFFRSASPLAFTRVSRTKGYRLIGWNALGGQRLLLAGRAPDVFPTHAPDELDGNPFTTAMRKMHWQNIAHLTWVEI